MGGFDVCLRRKIFTTVAVVQELACAQATGLKYATVDFSVARSACNGGRRQEQTVVKSKSSVERQIYKYGLILIINIMRLSNVNHGGVFLL